MWGKNAYEFRDMGHIFRKICPCLGTFSIKFAPPWALFLQYVPQLGHSLRKICSSWGTFSVKCVLVGALLSDLMGQT